MRRVDHSAETLREALSVYIVIQPTFHDYDKHHLNRHLQGRYAYEAELYTLSCREGVRATAELFHLRWSP